MTLEMASVSWGSDCLAMLPLTGSSYLPRLSFPHEEPEPQGPTPDLEIWKADFAGE